MIRPHRAADNKRELLQIHQYLPRPRDPRRPRRRHSPPRCQAPKNTATGLACKRLGTILVIDQSLKGFQLLKNNKKFNHARLKIASVHTITCVNKSVSSLGQD
jgi:hypothetical protein